MSSGTPGGGTSSERLSRLLALVPYLQRHQGVALDEAARTFGVSERQLMDDLDLVFVSGLPGYTPADLIEVDYEGGTVTIDNADTIARPLRLDIGEASALLVALRTLADVPGLADRDALNRAIAKLERATSDLGVRAGRVSVEVEAEDRVVPVVRKAVEGRRRLHLRYYVPGRDEVTERDVDPIRLLVVDGRSYLEAWCRRVDDVRLFRLDRVVDLRETGDPADVPARVQLRDADEGLFRASQTDLLVTFELGQGAHWVADYYPCESVTESDGILRATLRTPDTSWVRRLALRLGGVASVVDPPELVEQIRADAQAALAAYEDAAAS
jgi:proteasome accessory factor C